MIITLHEDDFEEYPFCPQDKQIILKVATYHKEGFFTLNVENPSSLLMITNLSLEGLKLFLGIVWEHGFESGCDNVHKQFTVEINNAD